MIYPICNDYLQFKLFLNSIYITLLFLNQIPIQTFTSNIYSQYKRKIIKFMMYDAMESNLCVLVGSPFIIV